ncbi:MAG: helix-turn-helix domain-containing protein [Candidatus Kapaibacteriota bacterium]|jgi:predicted HTH transcriptional regulator
MRRSQVQDMISAGESTTVEFKRKFTEPEKMAKELTAFANTKGGHLLIGIDDDRRIVGIPSEKTIMSDVERACYFYCDPPLTYELYIMPYDRVDIAIVQVPESKQKPHVVRNPQKPDETKVYIRQGEESVAASKEMIRIMRGMRPDAKPLMISITDKERSLFDFIEKKGRATVRDFSTLVNISDRRAARLLVRLVRAGVLNIHTNEQHDYYTLVERPN